MTKAELEDYLDQRDEYIEAFTKNLKKKVSEYQESIYLDLIENLNELDLDEANDAIEDNKYLIPFLAWYRAEIRKLSALSASYFGLHDIDRDFATEEPVRKFMSDFTQNIKSVKAETKMLMASILLGASTLKDAKRSIKERLIPKTKVGFIERSIFVKMRDTAVQSMRAIDVLYAKKNDMEYIFYAGGRMETSRCFCVQRYDRIWSLDKVNSWNNLSWSGKIEGVDVKVAAGGWNCVHSLLPVTQEEATQLGYDPEYGSCE